MAKTQTSAITVSQNAIASRIDEKQAADLFHKLIIAGDLKSMDKVEQIEYYKLVCNRIGLDPYQKPFDLLNLNGKLTLYANKVATAQLTSIRNLRVSIISQVVVGDQFVVTARAETTTGGFSEDIGVCPIANLKGDAVGNAMKKAATQAKRRAILSACGLGMLDETEVTQIQGAVVVDLPLDVPAVVPAVQAAEVVDIDEETEDKIAQFIAAIESATTSDEINELAVMLKQLSPIVKDNVRASFVARVKQLGLIHTINGYKENKNAK